MTNYLEVKNLSKSFDSFQLHNISFTLPKGYIMGLIGPNGSGKTTTIKLILNMLKRNSGEIKIMGLDNIADEQKAKAIFAIGRGGAKPRKDLAVWSEVKDYVAFFYEELFTPATEYPENISKEDTLAILNQYKGIYSAADDGEVWFNKVREMGEALGFAGKPKDYKKNPDQFKGHVGDVSQVIRLAITGRTNSPDLCSVMQILGEETCQQRLSQAIETVSR